VKLLVSGCSVTHGAELYNGFMSPENVKQSFSSHLSRKLNLELINVALSGSSNEYIFHSILSELDKHNNISAVLVVWTSLNRIYWKNGDRHYFFLPSWASSMTDLENFKMHDVSVDGAWITGDNEQIVDELSKIYKFLVVNHFDIKEMNKKLVHYKLCLSQICQSKNIKYYDTDLQELSKNTAWKEISRHPNHSEHIDISDFLYNKFFAQNQ
jgi:hypothetical protein